MASISLSRNYNEDVILAINHNNSWFVPPVKSGIEIEWDKEGTPGKLTFTTIKTPDGNMSFTEGDTVAFFYKNKPMFVGYVFTKSRDKQHHIKVTCYDQIRYLKNKYTYVFENKTAGEIIKAVCRDLNLNVGSIANTSYVIPTVTEEGTAAIDIALKVLQETLVNTGEMYVIYDDCGEIVVKNAADMVSNTLIMETTAEDFDYSSSIDDETYNSVILYYKEDDGIKLYSAWNNERIEQWGTLRYFEEVKNKTIAQNKANQLLQLYARKNRTLDIKGAFGDVTVRGGTLIPVKLNLGDIVTNNYMVVSNVKHKFEENHYTMDLTLDGAWEDEDIANDAPFVVEELDSTTSTSSNKSHTSDTPNKYLGQDTSMVIEDTSGVDAPVVHTLTVTINGSPQNYRVIYYDMLGKYQIRNLESGSITVHCKKGTKASIAYFQNRNIKHWGTWSLIGANTYEATMNKDAIFTVIG